MPKNTLGTYSETDLRKALSAGTFTIEAGSFTHLVQGHSSYLIEFLRDVYRDYPISLYPDEVVDTSVRVTAPNILRRFIRPQVIPDPGFDFPSAPLPAHMAPLAFEMGLNLTVALKCARFVSFHAGVVEGPKGAILMSAESGGGKSTLTAMLMEQGFRLLSDEFALLGLGEPVLHSYPRPVSLKNESIPIIRSVAGADWVSEVIEDSPKGDIAYRRARPEDIAAANRVAKPKLILFPSYEPGLSPMSQKLDPAEVIMRLIPASTNYSLLGEPAYRALVRLARDTIAFEVSYGSVEDSLRLINELYADLEAV